MDSITPYRKSIVKTLKSKFANSTATKIEGSIYRICIALSKEGEDLIEIYQIHAFEKVGELLTAKTKKERTKILDDIKKKKTGWRSSFYDSIREEQKLNDVPKITVEEGEFECRNKNCKSKRCRIAQIQTRSADEPMTVCVTCSICTTSYKFCN